MKKKYTHYQYIYFETILGHYCENIVTNLILGGGGQKSTNGLDCQLGYDLLDIAP